VPRSLTPFPAFPKAVISTTKKKPDAPLQSSSAPSSLPLGSGSTLPEGKEDGKGSLKPSKLIRGKRLLSGPAQFKRDPKLEPTKWPEGFEYSSDSLVSIMGTMIKFMDSGLLATNSDGVLPPELAKITIEAKGSVSGASGEGITGKVDCASVLYEFYSIVYELEPIVFRREIRLALPSLPKLEEEEEDDVTGREFRALFNKLYTQAQQTIKLGELLRGAMMERPGLQALQALENDLRGLMDLCIVLDIALVHCGCRWKIRGKQGYKCPPGSFVSTSGFQKFIGVLAPKWENYLKWPGWRLYDVLEPTPPG